MELKGGGAGIVCGGSTQSSVFVLAHVTWFPPVKMLSMVKTFISKSTQ